MSCKNDQDWEGSYVYKQECVKWWHLVTLREKFNQLWDLLKKEEKHDGVKYGYSSETEVEAKEQTEYSLADINGFCSVRFDEGGNYDEIYFKITSGDIIRRLNDDQYFYDVGLGASPGQKAYYGPWIVYLKDPCYGCTGYRFNGIRFNYTRTIVCNDNEFEIDPPDWETQCIWTRWGGGCDNPSVPITDWQQYCHFNFDWRASPYYQTKFGDVASKLFAKGPICVPRDKPCTVSRNYCCNEYALAHYTEEYMDHSACPENETAIAAGLPQSEWPYRMRRLKWVSLGVHLTNPQDEQQPFDDETFFCCDNSITGGVFEGWVTQKISAIHLTDIWDRIDTMVGGKPLRDCYYNQCKYHQNYENKYRWVYKDSVPMYVSGDTPDIMDRKETCQNCDKVSVGANICACNFNDINALLDEYLYEAKCYCYKGEYEGEYLTNVGSTTDCDCCVGCCCCDCVCCEDGYITEEECKEKKCEKNGPTWMGPYKKGQSSGDEKLGDQRPCGCSEYKSERWIHDDVKGWYTKEIPTDPGFPNVTCQQTCGTTSACCAKEGDGCACWEVTKCQCDAVKGRWQGYRTTPTESGSISKSCSDSEVESISGCQSKGYNFGEVRGGNSSDDRCDTCGDSSSAGGGSIPVAGKYDCYWGVDDRGYVQIGGQKYSWSAQGWNCACYGAGGGVAEGLNLQAGASVTGFGESADGSVGWSVSCYCAGPEYSPYNLDASGNPY